MKKATPFIALPIETPRLGSSKGFGKELVLMLTKTVIVIKNVKSLRALSKIKYCLSLRLKRKICSLTRWMRRTRMVKARTLVPILW